MNRRHFLTIALATAVAVIFASASVNEVGAQSKKSSATKKSSSKKKSNSKKKSAAAKSSKSKTKDKDKPTGRLPTYFGQIDLKPEQRVEIYSIQEKYHEQIEELEKELEALKEKQTKEIDGVLTSTQKKKLTSLRNSSGSEKNKTRSKSKSSKKK